MDNSTNQKIEEVSPNIQRPEEITGSIPIEYPTSPVQVFEQKSSKKGLILFLFIFFITIFGGFYWFFIRENLGNLFVDNQPQEVNLTYWGLWDDPSVYEEVIKEYEEKNPNVKIAYQKVNKEQYRERLIARSEASTGPDIFRFHNTWLPQISRVASAIPLDLLSNEEFEKSFYPIHNTDLKIGENHYGIPLMIDGLVMLYNKEILESSGVAKPPQNWVGGSNDLLSIASALTVRDTNQVLISSGVAIGEAENISHFGEIFTVLLLQNGGNLRELTTVEASDALQVYRKFAEDGIWNLDMPNSISAFIQGRVALIFAPSWQIHGIKAQNPALQIGVSALPLGINSKQLSISNYWAEGVSKTSKHQREAWKFLIFLSQREQLLKIYENQSKVRVFGNAYPRPDMADLLTDNEFLNPVIDQAKNSAYVTLPVADLTFDKGINDEILLYLKNAINETGKGVEYKVALQTAGVGVNQIFNRYLE
jgi:multiple sugar transport system substrate-binding protein